MKKILIVSLAFGFFIGGLFSFVNFAKADSLDAEGCLYNQNYSSTTGQRCGCSHNEVYSSTTGQICTREDQVTGFLIDLAERGSSTTMWGTHEIINEGFAVCVTTPCPSASSSYLVSAGNSSSVLSDLQRYENSRVKIIGKLQWYNLEGGFWGFVATRVIPINTNVKMIEVLSPNGGERIQIGQKYNIRWNSNSSLNNSDIVISLKYYDINCGPAPMVGCQTQFYIDTVKNTGSYLWDTSKKLSGASTGPNSVSVVAGSKYVIELSSSSGFTDESDNYFVFTSSLSDTPVISGIFGPQTLNVNQTGTWKITASDSNGGNLAYSVIWGDEDYGLSQPSSFSPQQIEQSATFTHTYGTPGIYNPIFTVTNTNGQNATTSLSVKVGNSIYPTPYLFERTLRIGHKGIDVQNLQTFLGLTIDGSFGPITRAKVMEWQRGVGLTPDGIFGPASRQKANSLTN